MEKTPYGDLLDIHCHLIPNIDDGPAVWEESLEMARMASQDGIRVAFTTPHWIQGTRWEPDPSEIRNRVKEFNERLRENEIPLKVFAGMEIGISENLPELLSSGRILMLGESNCLLIEIPFISLPYGIEEILFSLKAMGVSPILAHPERNKEIQKTPKRVVELVDAGALIQVTAGSFCGYFGEGARRSVCNMAKLGVIHAVASDAHDTRDRPPIVTAGLRVFEDIMGEEDVKKVISCTNAAILDGSGPAKG